MCNQCCPVNILKNKKKKEARSLQKLLVLELRHFKTITMSKSTFFTGQPIFNQVLSLIPRSLVSRLTRKYQGDRYCKKFRSYDHLVTMLFSTLHQCSSLREVITGMMASASRLKHLGLCSTPRRSTLSDANQRRNADFFADLYHLIYEHYYGSLPDSLKGKRLLDKLFIIDSTIVSLFSTVMS